MQRIKDVLRLKLEHHHSHQHIASSLGISKGVVAKYVKLASTAGLYWPQIQDMDETALHSRLMGAPQRASGFVSPDYAHLHQALQRKGIVDVENGLHLYLNDASRVAPWVSLLESLEKLEILLLHAIAQKIQPYGKNTALTFEKELGVKLTPSKIRSAVDKLVKKKLIAKLASGHVINDETFAEYLLSMGL